jgi:hypothetical protein
MRIPVSENLFKILIYVRGLMVATYYTDAEGEPTDSQGRRLRDLRKEQRQSC